MTIDFYGKEIDKYEHEHERAYVGYISPMGNLVDYNAKSGGKHNTISNIVSWTFLMWIKEFIHFEDLDLKDVLINATFDHTTGEIKNASIPESNKTNLELLKLQRDLINFLTIMENNPDFVSKVRERIDVNLIPDVVKRERKVLSLKNVTSFEIARVYGLGNTRNLLALLKDICIEYLGYDSIEKISPNGEYLDFKDYSKSDIKYYLRPRTIMTSHSDINVRFFNYLLMDYKITQVLGYKYNSSKGIFERDCELSYLMNSSKDSEYAEEIKNIKKLVPIKEREKYFI